MWKGYAICNTRGIVWKQVEKIKRRRLEYEKQYTNFGILFGDDRDCTWICKNCNIEYDDYIEEIYTDCKVVKHGCIPKAYCGKLSEIKKKYGIEKKSSCQNCKHFKSKR